MSARTKALLAACVAAALLAACAAPSSREAVIAFYAGQLDRAEQILQADIAEDDASQALFLCEDSSVLLARGDYEQALQTLLRAGGIMESFGGSAGREAVAVAGEEGHKQWKGEPYERMMNAYYIGLVSYLLGDEDNARAGFKDALFQDAGSHDQKYESDFGAALYLEGRLESRRGNRDDALRSFAEARVGSQNSALLADPDHLGNLLIVIDVGKGPQKVESGLQGSRLAYFDGGGHSSGVPVHVDGAAMKTALIGDVFFQATTRGAREVEKILHGKAVAKEIGEAGGVGLLFAGLFGERGSHGGRTLAAAGAGLLAASQLLRPGADTRHWGSLPREIHMCAVDLAPGTHELTIDLPVAGRVREAIAIEPGKERVLYYRAGIPYRRPSMSAPVQGLSRGESP
ncbi:MAG: hypothetical protein U1E76_08955 [Planctomycetota bacterium]